MVVDLSGGGHEPCDADRSFMAHVDADDLDAVRGTLTRSQVCAHDEALGAITRGLNGIRRTAFGPLAGPGETT